MQTDPTLNDRLLFGRKDAARILSVSPSFMTKAIRAGSIHVVRVGGRTLIHRNEIHRIAGQ